MKSIFKISLIFFLATVLVMSVVFYFRPFTLFLFSIPTFIWFILLLNGIFSIQFNYFFKSKSVGSKELKQIALTFDDGPHPLYTPIVLKILKKYNLKATFFCIGKNIEKHEEIFMNILKDGHEVGNHSYTHKNTIHFNRSSGWIDEISKTEALIYKWNNSSFKIFRTPLGITTPHLAKAIQITGLTSIGWNLRTFDTAQQDVFKVLKKLKSKTKNGSIILFHDTHPRIEFVLEQFLPFLIQNGFQPVRINELSNESQNV